MTYLRERRRVSLACADAAANAVARASHASLAALYGQWIRQLEDEAAGLPSRGRFPLRRL